MPDNQNVSTTAYDVATDKVTYSGDVDQNVQLFRPVHVTGAEGSKTVVDLTDAGGLRVNVGYTDYVVADANPNADLVTIGGIGPQAVAGLVFNGTTWDRLRGNTAGLFAQGNVAHDAVDSGNPVKIGGVAANAAPTDVASGDRVNAWFTLNGTQVVTPLATLNGTGTDGLSNTTFPQMMVPGGSFTPDRVLASGYAYNGTSWDRTRTTQGITTTTTNARETGVPAAGIGPGFTRRHSGTIGALNAAVTIDAGGVGSTFIDISGTWVGTLIFEYSLDGGTAWITSGALMTIIAGQDQWLGAAGTTTANGRFRHHFTGGMTNFRVRASAYTSGTATVVINGEHEATGVKAIEVGPAPHNIGFPITSKTAQYTAIATGTALWTPATGKKIVVTSYQIQAGGTTGGAVQLWYGATADTTYTRGTDLAIFDGEFAPSATSKPGIAQTGVFMSSTVDHVLRVTSVAAINPLTVTVWGYEV